jgi:ADP-heptose:LPS heptosyltransferase
LNYNLKIGVSLGGSIGDVLNVTAFIVGLKRQFPQSDITYFLFTGSEIVRGNKVINNVKLIPRPGFNEEIKKQRGNFDIFCEVRYPVKYFFSGRALKIPDIYEFSKRWEKTFKKNYEIMWEEFLSNIPRLTEFCIKKKMTVYDLRRDSSCLEYTDFDQFVFLSDVDYKASSSLGGMRLVTVNNTGSHGVMTKSWSSSGWGRVISDLKNKGLYVVQLGRKDEPDLPGVHERFYGTIHETAAVIDRAKFSIFIEGGLAHISKALGKKSIVLFGPTPIEVFGYTENINIRGTECSPCWHPRQGKYDWNRYCIKTGTPVDISTPACMQSLDFEKVIKASHKFLIDFGILAGKKV